MRVRSYAPAWEPATAARAMPDHEYRANTTARRHRPQRVRQRHVLQLPIPRTAGEHQLAPFPAPQLAGPPPNRGPPPPPYSVECGALSPPSCARREASRCGCPRRSRTSALSGPHHCGPPSGSLARQESNDEPELAEVRASARGSFGSRREAPGGPRTGPNVGEGGRPLPKVRGGPFGVRSTLTEE